jgi:broad specificity phosphatase PhoE
MKRKFLSQGILRARYAGGRPASFYWTLLSASLYMLFEVSVKLGQAQIDPSSAFKGSVVKIILVRHGETRWNREKRVQGRTDIELNDIGVEQAHRLACALQNEKIEAIYSSPLKRAHDTARIIGQFHGRTIEVVDGLLEMNQGDFEGLAYLELRDRHQHFLKEWVANPGLVRMPNGETLSELQERAWQVMESILGKLENALVVSHNFTIATILCKIRNIDFSQFRNACVDVASKTLIDCRDGQLYLETLNDTGHLKNLED